MKKSLQNESTGGKQQWQTCFWRIGTRKTELQTCCGMEQECVGWFSISQGGMKPVKADGNFASAMRLQAVKVDAWENFGGQRICQGYMEWAWQRL